MAAEAKAHKPSERGRRSLYWDSLNSKQRRVFEAALDAEGLDDEIAVLRTRLSEIAGDGENFELLLKGATVLARLLAARYRLSPGDTDAIEAAAARLVEGMKSLLEEDKR